MCILYACIHTHVYACPRISEYIQDFWNILDLISIFFFFLGFILREFLLETPTRGGFPNHNHGIGRYDLYGGHTASSPEDEIQIAQKGSLVPLEPGAASACTCTRTYAYTFAHAYAHTCTYTHGHMCPWSLMRHLYTRVHAHTHAHSRTHTRAHAHIHT